MTVTKGPVIGALNRVVRCTFVDDDTNPSLLDFPVQLSIGTSRFALYVGSGLLTTAALIILPQLLTGFCFLQFGKKWGQVEKKSQKQLPVLATVQRNVLANVAVLVLGYFGPITFKLPWLIVWHSSSILDSVIAILCPTVVLMIIGLWLFSVVRLAPANVKVFRKEGSRILEFENRVNGSLFVETFSITFDAARSMALIHRLLFFEDFVAVALVQILDGVRPEASDTCVVTGALMAVVCVAPSGYLLGTRPYCDRVEQGLAILGSLLMSTTAILGCVLTQIDTAAGAPSPLFTALGYAALINNAFFLLQAGILGVVAAADAHKKRFQSNLSEKTEQGKVEVFFESSLEKSGVPHPGGERDPSVVDARGTGALKVPLLERVECNEAPLDNPLTAREIF